MTLRSGWPVLSGTKGLLDRRRKETGATAKRRSSRTTRAARWTTEAAALDGCRLDDRHRPGRLDDAARREPGRLEQRGQLAHRALAAAGDGEHDDVERAAAGSGRPSARTFSMTSTMAPRSAARRIALRMDRLSASAQSCRTSIST